MTLNRLLSYDKALFEVRSSVRRVTPSLDAACCFSSQQSLLRRVAFYRIASPVVACCSHRLVYRTKSRCGVLLSPSLLIGLSPDAACCFRRLAHRTKSRCGVSRRLRES